VVDLVSKLGENNGVDSVAVHGEGLATFVLLYNRNQARKEKLIQKALRRSGSCLIFINGAWLL
jgi:hypothetical protein